jgi:hypothetical protein
MPNAYYQEKIISFLASAITSPTSDRITSKRSANRRSPLANIARFRLEAGTIETIDIWTDFPIAESGIIQRFTARLNGVDLFPDPDDQLDLAGTDHASVTGVAIAAVDGDILAIDLTAVSGSGVNAPIYFRVGMTTAGGGGGGSSVGVFSPDPPYVAPDTVDDEFSGGSLDPKWTTAINAPGTAFNLPSIVDVTSGHASAMSAIVQAVANADAVWRMKVYPAKLTGSNLLIGFVAKSAAGANYRTTFYLNCTNGAFVYDDWVFSTGVFSSNGTGISWSTTQIGAVYMELAYTAATHALKFRISPDGVTWKEIASTTTLSSGNIESIGIFCNGPAADVCRVEWFRKLQGIYTGGLI